MTSERDLIALDDKRREALLRGDVAVIDELFDDDLQYVHSTVREVDSKANYLAGLRSGDLKYKTIDLSERVGRVYGDCAVMTGLMRMDIFFRGQDRTVSSRYAATWIRRDDRWRMVLLASVPVPPA
jgi:NADPH-dependent 2,4-dienoyl-CoA reductase/sulfur reductase-like enzyme